MPATLSPDRALGATGVRVPLIGYGTAPLGKDDVPREHGVRCLNHALDLGMTYLDTSPDYGSEPVVGEVMRSRRDEAFLATKVNRRSREGALRQIHESLDALQTDHLDLLQIHAVNAWADLEQVFAPGGTLAACEQARAEGLIRFIGITGHARPDVLRAALERHRFDTVLVAVGMGDRLVSAPETILLPLAAERQVGVIAMKVYGHGAYPDRALCLRYALGLPGVSLAILGLEDEQQIDEAVALAQDPRPLDEAEESRLISAVQPVVEKDAEEAEKGHSTLFWLHDTAVLGWTHDDEPRLVRY